MEKRSLVKNAADEQQVKKAKQKEKTWRDRQLDDLYSILSTPQGRRFIYRLINDLCHYDKDDFNNSGSITFKSLGERNIGRIIKSDCCESSLKLYQLAEKENWNFLQGEHNGR